MVLYVIGVTLCVNGQLTAKYYSYMEFSSEELINLDVVNGLKELSGDGDDSFFKEIIGLYEEPAQELIDEIKFHAEEGNAEELGITAHTLKGASLNIGARLFADVCKNIELAGKNNEINGIDSEIKKLNDLNE